MEVSFYKIRLFRNDFILIPPQREFEIRDELASQLSRNLCRRRIAVGATGLIVVDIESSQAPRIRIFDRTGRKVSRLLDALLCAGRYLFDSGRTDGRTLEISTDIGIAELLIVDSQQFEADVGTPTDPESGGAIDPSPTTYSGTNIVIEGRRYAATAVGLSVECMVFLPAPPHSLRSFNDKARDAIGAKGLLPVFVKPISPDEQRVYSWPQNDPIDCTSIVACSAVASGVSGYADGIVATRFAASRAFARWDLTKNRVAVTASPEYVFSGEISAEVESE